jgi:hypothetical protein
MKLWTYSLDQRCQQNRENLKVLISIICMLRNPFGLFIKNKKIIWKLRRYIRYTLNWSMIHTLCFKKFMDNFDDLNELLIFLFYCNVDLHILFYFCNFFFHFKKLRYLISFFILFSILMTKHFVNIVHFNYLAATL